MPTGRNSIAPTTPQIGDEAVREKTGRTWRQWVSVLDAAGAREMPHREIARFIDARFGIGPWWSQMVTVGYEQLTGRRVPRETATGFSASSSLTVDADVTQLFDTAVAPGLAAMWLPRGVVVHKATRPKSLRATASDGRKTISVGFYDKGPGRTQVTAEQGRLGSGAEASRVKRQWAASLRRLALLCPPPRAGRRTATGVRSRTPPRRK